MYYWFVVLYWYDSIIIKKRDNSGGGLFWNFMIIFDLDRQAWIGICFFENHWRSSGFPWWFIWLDKTNICGPSIFLTSICSAKKRRVTSWFKQPWKRLYCVVYTFDPDLSFFRKCWPIELNTHGQTSSDRIVKRNNKM